MIKGVQRQTVILRTPENRFFEEVQFLLRTECGDRQEDDGEILREAGRILDECGIYREGKKKRRRKGRGLWMLFLGILCGGGLASALWIFLTLF